MLSRSKLSYFYLALFSSHLFTSFPNGSFLSDSSQESCVPQPISIVHVHLEDINDKIHNDVDVLIMINLRSETFN
jgi:hypothetical protein